MELILLEALFLILLPFMMPVLMSIMEIVILMK